METVVIVIHLMVINAMIAMVLLQRSEGAARGIGGGGTHAAHPLRRLAPRHQRTCRLCVRVHTRAHTSHAPRLAPRCGGRQRTAIAHQHACIAPTIEHVGV